MKHIIYLLMAIFFATTASLTSCGYNELGGHTPVADAGPDQNVKTGSLVILDGSGSSDADPDTLTYSWSFSSLPVASESILSGERTVNPTFIADIDGTYILSLVVNDGIRTSTEDTVTIISATDNSAPVAHAGPDQNVETNSLVTLDGSGSSDANGDTITYLWAFKSLPESSIATLSDETAVNPTFTADLDGEYVLSLAVNDGSVDSAADDVSIIAATANSAPTANSGPNQNVVTGSTVTLDGSGSFDANGDNLTYKWAFSSRPDKSTATLSDPTTAKPSFTADLDGSYVLTLIVNDGQLDSAVDVVLIVAATDNSAPVANAGPDQNVATGTLVTLDGSGSSDADLDPLTYDWSFVSGSGTLSDSTAENPTFTADLDGTYILSLVVNDGQLDSPVDVVLINAATGNSAPVVNAGPDQNVAIGALVTLDGSGSSDADLDPLTFDWSFKSLPDGSNATLSDSTAETPTFTADLDGSYVLQLIVNDGTVNSAADAVTVIAITPNLPPAADAGADQDVATGTTVTLSGSGSVDPDDDPLTFSWAFTSRPAGSTATLSDTAAENPTFTADREGTYVLQLTVNDGTVNSTADSVTVTATTPNSPPIADAGADQNVATSGTVTLDGSGSFDPDGDPLTFSWAFTSRPAGSSATLSDAAAENPTFTADLEGTYVLQLIVNDGTVNSTADAVTVIAVTPNSPPTADAGADQDVATGTTVTLSGSGSVDPDDDPLTFSWAFTSRPAGSSATLSDAAAENPTFTADLEGTYVLQLIVNDGTVNSTADAVTVIAVTPNSPPTADAGADQDVATGTTVTLSGSGSVDPDDDPLTFSWAFTSRPAGSTATLSDTATGNPTFTADLEGAYVLQLIVNDGTVNSAADEVTVIAVTPNSPPTADAGADQDVATGTTVTLSGSGSVDPDDDPLTFSWAFTSRPAGSTAILSNATAANPTFFAGLDGSYVLSLVVNDGSLDSTADEVIITASNLPPVAVADAPPEVTIGTTVILDGTGSYDPNDDPLSYNWSFISVAEDVGVTLTGGNTTTASFTATNAGKYTLELIVNDGTFDSAPDKVTINSH
ncbi:MAG: PKD domain-containing protein [Desulfuromonadales bacterium]|nr:PKD domain-containing protein [Desulfuromonadales bacterium]